MSEEHGEGVALRYQDIVWRGSRSRIGVLKEKHNEFDVVIVFVVLSAWFA